MKVTKEMLQGILKDWRVVAYDDDGSFDVSQHSPEGEEIVMSLQGETLEDMAHFVEEYRRDYDAGDHAAQIYHAKHYGSADEQRFFASAPESLEDLLKDAKAIDKMYQSLAKKLASAAKRLAKKADKEGKVKNGKKKAQKV